MATIVDKIDDYMKKLEKKHPKNSMGQEIQFLYATEEDESFKEILGNVLEAVKGGIGGREYDDFFKSMLKKWKVKSYKDLPKDKQKKFFNEVDAKWKAKKETD